MVLYHLQSTSTCDQSSVPHKTREGRPGALLRRQGVLGGHAPQSPPGSPVFLGCAFPLSTDRRRKLLSWLPETWPGPLQGDLTWKMEGQSPGTKLSPDQRRPSAGGAVVCDDTEGPSSLGGPAVHDNRDQPVALRTWEGLSQPEDRPSGNRTRLRNSSLGQEVLPNALIFFTVFSVLLVTVTVTGMGSPWK